MRETITVRNDAPISSRPRPRRAAAGSRATPSRTSRSRDGTSLGMLKLLPGVVDTNPREAPSWNLLTGLTINGRSSGFNLTYDGITNKETATAATSRPPRLDSIAEMPRAVVELPGRVRPQLRRVDHASSPAAGRSDFRGSAAFYKRDAALNGNEYLPERAVRAGRSAGRLRAGVLRVRQRRVDARAVPSWCLGSDFNRSATGCSSSGRRKCWRGPIPGRSTCGACRRRSNVPGTSRRPSTALGRLIFIRDPQLLGGLQRRDRRARAVSPDNVIPAESHRPDGQALLNLFPLPNAIDPIGREPVQLHLSDGDGLAAQRPGPARRLERRAAHDRLRARAVRLREP